MHGGTKVSRIFAKQGRGVTRRGDNSFVPSPSANLVGVAKEIQQGLSPKRARFKMCFPAFNKHEADIRSSQREKFRSKERNFLRLRGKPNVYFSLNVSNVVRTTIYSTKSEKKRDLAG